MNFTADSLKKKDRVLADLCIISGLANTAIFVLILIIKIHIPLLIIGIISLIVFFISSLLTCRKDKTSVGLGLGFSAPLILLYMVLILIAYSGLPGLTH